MGDSVIFRYGTLGIAMFLSFCASSKKAVEVQPAVRGVTLRGDTITLRGNAGETFVVLYNGYSCRDCFTYLDKSLHNLRVADSNIQYIVLARVGSSPLTRRTTLADITNLMPEKPSVIFESANPGVEDPWPPTNLQGGVFGRFKITKTPAVVVVQWDTIIHISYDSLFGGIVGLTPHQEVEALERALKDFVRKKE